MPKPGHQITVRSEKRLFSTEWWCARCSCGKYLSRYYETPGKAEEAGRAHVKAKTAHTISTSKEQRLDGLGWWRSTCSCGEYSSGLHWSPSHAEKAGEDHVRDKERGAA